MKLTAHERRRVDDMLVELERMELRLQALLTTLNQLRRPSAKPRKSTVRRIKRCQ